jgi:phosphatidylcholine synthase
VALYLWHWHLPPSLNAGIVLVLSMMVLLPIRFIYPSKTPHWRRFNVVMMSLWGILVLASLCTPSAWGERCFWWSNAFPIYYMGMSFWLHCQDKPENTRRGQKPAEEPEHER